MCTMNFKLTTLACIYIVIRAHFSLHFAFFPFFFSEESALRDVSLVVERHTPYSFSVTIVSDSECDISWPTKVNKDDVLIDLRSLQGWSVKRSSIVGPSKFQSLVRRTITIFCAQAQCVNQILVKRDEYSQNQELRDFAGNLFTLDKSLLLLYDLQRKHSYGMMPPSVDVSKLYPPADPYLDLCGFTPSKLKSLSLSSPVTVNKKCEQKESRASILAPILGTRPHTPKLAKQTYQNNNHHLGKQKQMYRPKMIQHPRVHHKSNQKKGVSKGNLKKDDSCWRCGKPGHIRKNCKNVPK